MSANSRERKRRRNFRWEDGANGTSTLVDHRTEQQKAKDAAKDNRRVRRDAEIASGVRQGSGCGVHGGTVKQKHRRDRRDTRVELKRGGDNY